MTFISGSYGVGRQENIFYILILCASAEQNYLNGGDTCTKAGNKHIKYHIQVHSCTTYRTKLQ